MHSWMLTLKITCISDCCPAYSNGMCQLWNQPPEERREDEWLFQGWRWGARSFPHIISHVFVPRVKMQMVDLITRLNYLFSNTFCVILVFDWGSKIQMKFTCSTCFKELPAVLRAFNLSLRRILIHTHNHCAISIASNIQYNSIQAYLLNDKCELSLLQRRS